MGSPEIIISYGGGRVGWEFTLNGERYGGVVEGPRNIAEPLAVRAAKEAIKRIWENT